MKFVIVLSFASAALAQTTITSSGGAVSRGTISFSGAATSRPGDVVTGMPFSAEQVTENVQTLADGTHITRPAEKTMLYRDSQGRTRVEHVFTRPAGAPTTGFVAPSIIEISDPIAGTHYTLDARNHTARKMSSLPATLPPPPLPPNSGTIYARPSTRLGQPAGSAGAALGPDAQGPRPQFSNQSLGTQMIEGVSAEGSRSTIVYPIGFFGNDRSITEVRETWTSPELKVVVMSKSSDPRSGESSTKLTNLSRNEPDPAIFEIPADYEVIDTP